MIINVLNVYVVIKNILKFKIINFLLKKIKIKISDVYFKLILNVIVMNKNLFVIFRRLKFELYMFIC